MQLALLTVEEGAERLLEPLAYHRNDDEPLQRRLNQGLVKRDNDEQLLDVHLDDGLADQGGAEERPEGDEEVAACDSGEVKQRVWDLKKSRGLFYNGARKLEVAATRGERRKEKLWKFS